MSNKEGYPDKTAEIAIGRVSREQKMAEKYKTGGKMKNGNKSSTTKIEKSNKN